MNTVHPLDIVPLKMMGIIHTDKEDAIEAAQSIIASFPAHNMKASDLVDPESYVVIESWGDFHLVTFDFKCPAAFAGILKAVNMLLTQPLPKGVEAPFLALNTLFLGADDTVDLVRKVVNGTGGIVEGVQYNDEFKKAGAVSTLTVSEAATALRETVQEELGELG